NAKWGIWLNRKLIAGDQRSFLPVQLVFSPDSKRLAIRMRLDKIVAGLADCSFAVMIEGKLDPEFFDVLEGSLRFSSDAKRFADVAGDDKDKFFLVENGAPGAAYNFIRP